MSLDLTTPQEGTLTKNPSSVARQTAGGFDNNDLIPEEEEDK